MIILACLAALVIDGDNLRCPGGSSRRLARIDAPDFERSPRCRRPKRGTVCDDRLATRSRNNLRRLLAAGPLRCTIVDASPGWRGFQRADRYGRPVVRCTVAGVDLGAAQVAGGFAARWP